MHPIEHYEALLYSRRKLLECVHSLTAEQFVQEFAFGHTTVRATLAHLAGAEWLCGRLVRSEEFKRGQLPFTATTHPDLASLEMGWKQLEATTRAWLESEKNWSRRLEKIST